MAFSRLFRLALLVFALLAAAPAFAQTTTFAGEVIYRERLALPANARLVVTLVSLPDRAQVASATAPIGTPGQAPLSFVLHVKSAAMRNGGPFGILAEIQASGRRLFRNAVAVPVEAGNPGPVDIVVGYDPATLPPPSEALPTPSNPLADTGWVVTSIGGDPALASTEVTFSIGADLRAGGHGGCNSYFAEAQVGEDALALGPVAGTRMACAADVMAQENRFLAVLAATARYALDGNALQLQDAAGVTLAGLVRAP